MALARCGEVRSLKTLNDGQEVVDYLRGEPPFDQPSRLVPNIIFMDLNMPRINGFEVLTWLRKNPECSVIPVIILSSSVSPEEIMRAYQLGANAFFEKPTAFVQLQSILRSILKFWTHALRPPITALKC